MNLSKFIVLFAAAILSISCGSSREYAYSPVADVQQEEAKTPTGEDRKIIYNAYLSLTVDHPDSTNQALGAISKKYNGYVNEMGTYQSVIRVRSDQLNVALEEVAQLGRVDRKNVRGQDVTEEYLDYQIRLENAQKSRNRYLELLEMSTTVDEVLKVEKELERLNETIDLLKGKMNRIEQLDAYATITVSLKERRKPGLIGYIGIGIYRGIRWLFVRN